MYDAEIFNIEDVHFHYLFDINNLFLVIFRKYSPEKCSNSRHRFNYLHSLWESVSNWEMFWSYYYSSSSKTRQKKHKDNNFPSPKLTFTYVYVNVDKKANTYYRDVGKWGTGISSHSWNDVNFKKPRRDLASLIRPCLNKKSKINPSIGETVTREDAKGISLSYWLYRNKSRRGHHPQYTPFRPREVKDISAALFYIYET